MAHEGSTKAIIAALIANLGIAITKFIAYLISGAASMLAESVHSLADTTNQFLLIIGGKQAKKAASAEHPFGYGRSRYVYAFIVSVVLFTVGGVFSIYEGLDKLQHPHEIENIWIPIVVLIIGLILEGYSLRTAMKESMPFKGNRTWLQFVRRAKSPELPVVLLEDTAAELGLLFALMGVGLSAITGNPMWDAIATLAIGGLLVVVAIILGFEMASLLIGEGASQVEVYKIRKALESSEYVTKVIHMKTLYLGPDELLVAVKIGIKSSITGEDVARAIDNAEAAIRKEVEIARVIYIEPDIARVSA